MRPGSGTGAVRADVPFTRCRFGVVVHPSAAIIDTAPRCREHFAAGSVMARTWLLVTGVIGCPRSRLAFCVSQEREGAGNGNTDAHIHRVGAGRFGAGG